MPSLRYLGIFFFKIVDFMALEPGNRWVNPGGKPVCNLMHATSSIPFNHDENSLLFL